MSPSPEILERVVFEFPPPPKIGSWHFPPNCHGNTKFVSPLTMKSTVRFFTQTSKGS